MMEPVNKDVKEAVLGADKFLSVTLTQEKLSPSTEKERSLLAEKFKNLITQLGLQSELPARGCKAPPRPPKGGISIPAPVTNGAGQEGEELYDDIAGVIPDDQYYSPMGPSGEEESSNTDAGGENYEIMSGDTEPVNTAPHGDAMVEEYVAMEDAQGGQEDYEEPGQQAEQKQQDSAPQEEEYEMPGTDPDYEETENPPADDMYEGVEPADDNLTTGEGSVDGAPNRERTVTVNMENLMKDTKPENIEGVILQGFLHKHRKEGKVYFGSKYQKRFCVVRNHMLYYFKDKKSPKQQGCILLPGYQVTTANKKGREFTLSHPEGHRSFQFEATSKKEADKWITALQSAANAPLSMRNSVNLDELRNKQPSGDEDSLHYDDLGQSNTSTTEVQQEANEDVYDDTNEDMYEVVGSVQLSAPSQPSNAQLAEYEITGASATSPKPAAEPSPAEPVVDEDYELPGQSPAPALPPPRPVKSVTQPPQDEVPPVVPPPRHSKAPPPSPKSPAPTPPIQDDTYEIADTPEDTKAPPPPPSGEIELEDYEALDTFQEPLPPPPMPAKVSPPSGAGQAKSQENVPERPGVKPTPPVPAREDETPPSLAEEKTSYINYANVYQALWDCTADEEEELGFRRGDLIYIYEKPHADWWIGSLFKPQGYSVGLVPKDYVMEAYEFTAA